MTAKHKPPRRGVFTCREGDQWYGEVLDMDTGDTLYATGLQVDENTAYWKARLWAEDTSVPVATA